MKKVKKFLARVDLSSVPLEKWKAERMYKQGYRFVGRHSAIKVCEWTKKSIRKTESCYKNKFYKIESHRCVQMSPAAFFCDYNCVHCWRSLSFNLPDEKFKWDSPQEIFDGCLKAQKRIIQGYKSEEIIDKAHLSEAEKPIHFAISLSGEPTLYPHLPEFINLIKQNNMTSFLVTNGAHPDMIKKLLNAQPTNLYVTLHGPDKETFKKECCPRIDNGWEELQETLSLLKQFSCQTVIRLTLNKLINFHSPEKYAEIIKLSQPTFVECKGYTAIGGARAKMGMSAMPSFSELSEFAKKISEISGYKTINEKENSCVILLEQGAK
jgi:tRNA wybutosine-synthesizing protein 1